MSRRKSYLKPTSKYAGEGFQGSTLDEIRFYLKANKNLKAVKEKVPSWAQEEGKPKFVWTLRRK
jgi:hypothetical protein